MKKNKTSNRQKAGYKRQDLRKGGRVGYQRGKAVVDKETGEVLETNQQVLTPGMTVDRNVQQSKFGPVTTRTTAPVAASAPTPSSLPPGIDPRAVAADPAGYQKWLEGAKAQEAAVPGSTSLSNQQFGEATPAPTPAPKTKAQIEEEARLKAEADRLEAEEARLAGATSQLSRDNTASRERTARIEDTADTITQAAQGVVPEAAKIADVSTEAGTKLDTEIDSQVTTMADPTKVTTEGAPQVAPETVTTGDVTTAQTPQEIQAAKMAATTVSPDAQVEAAEGEVSQDAVAQAAGVERIDPTQAATIDIPEGALTERVVGTLSPEAQSTAVQNVGSSLARVTRAKKQLANAGISAEDIATLGNDPEDLEDRLLDLTEAERGVIAGLPEDALVSNQLDSLLKGIEEGEIPTWARPAVASVEAMLAQRGMSASTVGRDALFNAIITSAMPMAQSNAQAIQASVGQQKAIEAQEAEANAARGQQTALSNAQTVFQMDMAQFSSDQQIALSNSKFLQTVGITDASMDQQAIIQDAALMSQANLTEADFNQRTQIQNAQAFLQMDLTNLSNNQQANVLKAQQNQQRVLSNQAAQNAASQFNAASENQTNQFMTNLNAQMNQYNSSQANAMSQFNATQTNAAEARDAQREADVNKFNSQLVTQVDQFNSQQDFARNQWNAQNAAAVEASNVQWRRQSNTINTAAQNQINMQNAQNAYGMSVQSQSFLWQELRDQADFDFRSFENEENRKAQIISTAMANEGKAGEKYDDYLDSFLGGLTGSYNNAFTYNPIKGPDR